MIIFQPKNDGAYDTAHEGNWRTCIHWAKSPVNEPTPVVVLSAEQVGAIEENAENGVALTDSGECSEAVSVVIADLSTSHAGTENTISDNKLQPTDKWQTVGFVRMLKPISIDCVNSFNQMHFSSQRTTPQSKRRTKRLAFMRPSLWMGNRTTNCRW